MKIKTCLIPLLGLSLLASSCKKDSCYDKAMEERYKNNFCPMDCPGVKGCDGKTYCNTCEASRRGIKVVE